VKVIIKELKELKKVLLMSRSERKCVDIKGKVNSPMYYRAVNVKQSSGQGH